MTKRRETDRIASKHATISLTDVREAALFVFVCMSVCLSVHVSIQEPI